MCSGNPATEIMLHWLHWKPCDGEIMLHWWHIGNQETENMLHWLNRVNPGTEIMLHWVQWEIVGQFQMLKNRIKVGKLKGKVGQMYE